MQPITAEAFAMVCFLILMENNDGVLGKAPGYIMEKRRMIVMGEEAFGKLDINNMRKVREYCDFWKVEMPQACRDYLRDSEDAEAELARRSVFL